MFELPDLGYEYDSLEPSIDARTMGIHHGKHHAGYVKKLNEALEGTEFADKKIEELLKDLDSLPSGKRKAVRNNGGGHANHTLFWQVMTPDAEKRKFEGKIADAINEFWGSFEEFKKDFTDEALSRFGSGWCWLVISEDGNLEVISTPNQDSPLSDGMIPLLGLDVWEHAYYLHYQNRRNEYVESWWNVINWQKVNELYEKVA